MTPNELASDSEKTEEPTASLTIFSSSTPVPWTGWEVDQQFVILWCNLTLSAMTCQVMAGSGTPVSQLWLGWKLVQVQVTPNVLASDSEKTEEPTASLTIFSSSDLGATAR